MTFSPAVWISAGVGFLMSIAAAFGYGYYVGTQQLLQELMHAQEAAVQAQYDANIAANEAAAEISALRVQAAAKQKVRIETIVQRLTDTVTVTNECKITPAAIQLLNEAGHVE